MKHLFHYCCLGATGFASASSAADTVTGAALAEPVPPRKANSRRSGTVFIAVLACLVIATTLVTSTVRTALQARRAVRTQLYLEQTQLLLSAGVQRAAHKLQSSLDYQGEVWNLPASVLPGNYPAEVEITLSPDREGLSRMVSVTARLLVSPHSTFQRSYAFSYEPSVPPGKE
jgi:hypothetical protein